MFSTIPTTPSDETPLNEACAEPDNGGGDDGTTDETTSEENSSMSGKVKFAITAVAYTATIAALFLLMGAL
jgi:hypothetical protein